MYAVLGIWSLDPGKLEEQRRGLEERIVPSVKESPGFISGYWMEDRATAKAYSTIILEDQTAAQRFKEIVEQNAPSQSASGVTFDLLTIVEVVADAHG